MSHAITQLPYTGPFDWPAVREFLARRAVAGVERVTEAEYCRAIEASGATGTLAVRHDPEGRALTCEISGAGLPVGEITRRVRWMFDLDAALTVINRHLAADPWLAPQVEARPTIRVFHGWDGFEVAMRSIIGQQVSVARARDLNGVLVDRCGVPLRGGAGGPCRLFPTAAQVLEADLGRLGMPGARAATLKAMARAALDDPGLFARGPSIDVTVARLRAIKGVGDWTAHYIAMRACGEPDAFPASDIGLLRGAAGAGARPLPRELLRRAEAWRPWRAYAAHHLWAVDPT